MENYIIISFAFKNYDNGKKSGEWYEWASNGELLISGFYKKDLKNVNQMLKACGFELIEFKTKNRWVASKYCYN